VLDELVEEPLECCLLLDAERLGQFIDVLEFETAFPLRVEEGLECLRTGTYGV